MSSAVREKSKNFSTCWSVDTPSGFPAVPLDFSVNSEYFEETHSENQVKEQGNALGKKRQSSHIIWEAKDSL